REGSASGRPSWSAKSACPKQRASMPGAQRPIARACATPSGLSTRRSSFEPGSPARPRSRRWSVSTTRVISSTRSAFGTMMVRPPSPPVELVRRRQLLVALGEPPGEIDHDPTLLEGGVVLHLAVDHHRTGAVAHGGDDLLGPQHLGGRRAEDPPGDVDLHGVEAPRPDAAHEERVAELVLARDRVFDVAEGP